MIIIVSFVFATRRKKDVSGNAEEAEIRGGKFDRAMKDFDKLEAENLADMKPELDFSIASMGGIAAYTSDENLKFFFSEFTEYEDEETIHENKLALAKRLVANEEVYKKHFLGGIHSLIKKLKGEKDTDLKISTSCFQMHFISTYFPEALEVNIYGEFIANLKFIIPNSINKYVEELNFSRFVLEFIDTVANRENRAEQFFVQLNFLKTLEKINKYHSLELVDKKKSCRFCIMTSVTNSHAKEQLVAYETEEKVTSSKSVLSKEELEARGITITKQGMFQAIENKAGENTEEQPDPNAQKKAVEGSEKEDFIEDVAKGVASGVIKNLSVALGLQIGNQTSKKDVEAAEATLVNPKEQEASKEKEVVEPKKEEEQSKEKKESTNKKSTSMSDVEEAFKKQTEPIAEDESQDEEETDFGELSVAEMELLLSVILEEASSDEEGAVAKDKRRVITINLILFSLSLNKFLDDYSIEGVEPLDLDLSTMELAQVLKSRFAIDTESKTFSIGSKSNSFKSTRCKFNRELVSADLLDLLPVSVDARRGRSVIVDVDKIWRRRIADV